MNLLLDTHAFLWSLFSPEKLSHAAICEMKLPDNHLAVSVVSFWEISLKYALGKLELIGVKPDDLPRYAAQMNLETLPISPTEASTFYRLPRLHHKDPFDRLIIWQAIQHNMTLISKDKDFQAYSHLGLKTLW